MGFVKLKVQTNINNLDYSYHDEEWMNWIVEQNWIANIYEWWDNNMIAAKMRSESTWNSAVSFYEQAFVQAVEAV